MNVPEELIADSGLKTHVRNAVRPHLEFILLSKKAGASEAAIHRHLLKKGHAVGSRSGFRAALKFLLAEGKGPDLSTLPVDPAGGANPTALDAPLAVAAQSTGSAAFADERHKLRFGSH